MFVFLDLTFFHSTLQATATAWPSTRLFFPSTVSPCIVSRHGRSLPGALQAAGAGWSLSCTYRSAIAWRWPGCARASSWSDRPTLQRRASSYPSLGGQPARPLAEPDPNISNRSGRLPRGHVPPSSASTRTPCPCSDPLQCGAGEDSYFPYSCRRDAAHRAPGALPASLPARRPE